MIRQISFDFWNTLFRANPAYGEARNRYLTESKYNVNGFSQEDVYVAYKRVDARIDWLTERQGFSFRPIQLYAMVCHELGYPLYSNRDLRDMADTFHALFSQHPPLLYSDDTLPVLTKLAQLGYSLNIASNTGFITGHTLRQVALPPLGIPFSFSVYSDQLPYAKPHRLFFEQVIDQAQQDSAHILHVGDNAKTDYEGATCAGLSALLINTTPLTIQNVLLALHHEPTL